MKRFGTLLLGIVLIGCRGSGAEGGIPPGPLLLPKWTFQHRLPTSSHLRAVRFVSAATGWGAGEGSTLLRTDDGGNTWTHQEHDPDFRGGTIIDLDTLDTSTVEAVGNQGGGVGRFWITFNGGRRWDTPDVNDPGFDPFTAIQMIRTDLVVSLTQSGEVRRIKKGLEAIFSIGTAGTYHDIEFPVDGMTAFVCGDSGAIPRSPSRSVWWWWPFSPSRTGSCPSAPRLPSGSSTSPRPAS